MLRGRRQGRVTLGVLLLVPATFSALAAQARIGMATIEHRRALSAATDAAMAAGHRTAEAWNYIATTSSVATSDQATLAGLQGLLAAAASNAPEAEATYATRIAKVQAGIFAFAGAQKASLEAAAGTIEQDLTTAAHDHGMISFTLVPARIPHEVANSAEACRRVLEPDPSLGGLVPVTQVEAVASGVATRFWPAGPALFTAAFSAALTRCTHEGLLPDLELLVVPARQAFAVRVARAHGDAWAGFAVVQTGSPGSPTFTTVPLTGPEIGAVPGASSYAILAP